MSATAGTPLDVAGLPLAGTRLVEASAGTGKTHAIADLYLRLVVQRGLTPAEIVVLTYTRAATAELRTRVRVRLRRARAALEDGADGDALLDALVAGEGDRPGARRRLDLALESFDEAAIHTIHGFCQRVLAEHAFESGLPFETEVVGEDAAVLVPVVEDFWRRETYPGDPALARRIMAAWDGPRALARWLGPLLDRHRLRVPGPDHPPDLAPATAEVERRHREAATLWSANRETLADLLLNSPALSRTRYRVASVRSWIPALDRRFSSAADPGPPEGWFDRLTPERLRAATKKGHDAPGHPFFDACGSVLGVHAALAGALDEALAAFARRALAWCRAERRRRARTTGRLGYADLLAEVHAALAGDPGGALAEALRARFRFALVDEFQDTDPLQLEVFRILFGGEEHGLVLVGDPKQAIYGFRGADVHTYLAAGRAAGGRYRLDRNWRSVPAVVEAVNALFGRVAHPFLIDGIDFHAVEPAGLDHGALSVRGESGAGLVIWHARREAGDGPAARTREVPRVAAAVAGEVARLVALGRRGDARIGERPLRRQDIAVLVRTHPQALAVREALAGAGVACVEHGDRSVFAGEGAEMLERVLAGVAVPERSAALRGALATPLLGLDAADIAALDHDAGAQDRWAERFRGWRTLWRERGVLRAFRVLLRDAGAAAGLLARPEGERWLTDLLQLAELLHAEERAAKRRIESLLAWLADRRANADRESGEARLRLESDEDRVQVCTVHRSKGLQYPVVFVPFAWTAPGGSSSGPGLVGRPDPGGDLVLDLGAEPAPALAAASALEARAEEIRLLYVALTRARQRCYLVWDGAKDAGGSAAGRLLLGDPGEDPDALDGQVDGLTDAGAREALETLAAAAGPGAMRVVDLPASGEPAAAPPEARPVLAPRVFRGRVAPARRITSFTALAAAGAADLPDHDAGHAPVRSAAPDPALGLAGFPGGARAGSCLHAILEHLDFADAGPGRLADHAGPVLSAYGFEPENWLAPVVDGLGAVLDTALDAGGDVRLRGLGVPRTLREMAFQYPVAGLAAGRVRDLLAAHGGPDPAGIPGFDAVSGQVRGFVDLVFEHGGRFHVADYKSNWLGPAADDYAPRRLEAAMRGAGYGLQALLYALAVHRYLDLRLPGYRYETHFGGVYYLFLRGMSPARGAERGVHDARPPAGLVRALDAALSASGEDCAC